MGKGEQMNALNRWLSIVAIVLMIQAGSPAVAAEESQFKMSPSKNGGQKWKIGYYQGGSYVTYPKNLLTTVKGLMELGWIVAEEIPSDLSSQSQTLWQWLSKDAKSEYIVFVEDAFYTANWEESTRSTVVSNLLKRLKKQDLNLMIAMGTWAGQDLSNDQHSVPTIVLSTSDPISSGIIKSAEDSGHAHVHARVDPYRYERQIRIFHDIISFEKLGTTYEDTVRGRSYAALDKIEKVADERNFEIVRCHYPKSVSDVEIAEKSAIECFQELSTTADAIYVTMHMGVNDNTLPAIVKATTEANTPTFSQAGSDEVKYGLLMSISQAEFRYVGEFYAETIAKIFNGAKPGELNQIFEDPPKIAINLKTAENIGYDPPVDVLGAADEIYTDIKSPSN